MRRGGLGQYQANTMSVIHYACLTGDLITVKKLNEEYLGDVAHELEDEFSCEIFAENPLIDLDQNTEWERDFFIGGTSRQHYPLHYAVKGNNPEVVKYILDQVYDEYTGDEIEIDCKDSNGMTPLYYAYYYGHHDCADLLLSAGAETKEGWEEEIANDLKEITDAVFLPYFCNKDNCMKELISYVGVDPSRKNADWIREKMSYREKMLRDSDAEDN